MVLSKRELRVSILDHRPSKGFQARRLLRYWIPERNSGKKFIRKNIRYLIKLLKKQNNI